MLRFIGIVLALFCIAGSVLAQVSSETFGQIRLEDPGTPGQAVSLRPPSGITPYTLIFPASMANGSWVLTHTADNNIGIGTWQPWTGISGTATQIPYFSSATQLTGNASLTWDNSNQALSLTGTTGNSNLLSVAKSGTVTADNTVLSLSHTATSVTSGVDKTVLAISASGSVSTGATVTGIDVNVAGGTVNYAALFRSGRVGVGLGASGLPNTQFDIAEDAATRELNYTGTLNVGTTFNNNLEFNTGNRAAFIRVATTGLTNDYSITGLAGGTDGKHINIFNATNQTMVFEHENTGSLAANRFITPTGYDLSIPPRTGVIVQYSATAQRWYVMAAGVSSYNTFATDIKTVTNTDYTLPTSSAAYILVNNNNGNNFDIALEDGVAVGQIICVQCNGPNSIRLVDGGNTNVFGTTMTLPNEAAVLFIWDGTKWIQAARATG